MNVVVPIRKVMAHSRGVILLSTVLLIILVSLPFQGLSPTRPLCMIDCKSMQVGHI
jgi:hypothetical protein